ncbi:uncharacterized protein [Musca autumnalis]|uniref:uncharacterized protein n=1 Tax=Musca autumnalis TaxID=221902 RepID=UPI003CEC45FA
MSSTTKTYTCPTCNSLVKGNQNSVGCSICGMFYHIKCVNVTTEQHNFLYKNRNNKMFSFKCPTCIKKPTRNVDANSDVAGSSRSVAVLNEADICDKVFDSMQKELDDYKLCLQNQFETFMLKMKDVVKKLREDLDVSVQRMEESVRDCRTVIGQLEHTLQEREIENDILTRRLNRSNVIINGLPDGIKMLREPVMKIASLCGIDIRPSDINHCCYISKGKSILVKFNSVYLRDGLMASYQRRRNPLLLCEVTGVSVRSRVYLNDHHNRAASKLMYLCRKLWRCKKIRKFKLLSADNPKALVMLPDGKEDEFDVRRCADMLENDTQPVAYSQQSSGNSDES